MIIRCDARINLFLLLLELKLSRVFKFCELNTTAAYHINCFHESLHALPHVSDWLLELLIKMRSQVHLVLAEYFAHFGIPRWVGCQGHLLHRSVIRVSHS